MTNTALPLLSQVVLHDAFRDTFAAVDLLLENKDPRSGCIVPVLGPTRVGKSAVMRRLLDLAGPASSLLPLKDIVWASLPPQSNGKEIYGSILHALHQRTAPHENTKSTRERLFRAIERLGIKVIIIDEVNHLIERGANLTPRAAADHLKTIVDATGVSLVLSGLPRFQRILDENEQLRDRACGTILFKPYDWQIDDDRDAFADSVDAAFGSLNQSGFPIALDFADGVRRLYGASGGRVPVMMRILKLCALLKPEPQCLQLCDLERAAKAMQQSGIPTASFFAQEEPDEVEILRSFACTMSEAGLKFSAHSLAGLDLAWGAHTAS